MIDQRGVETSPPPSKTPALPSGPPVKALPAPPRRRRGWGWLWLVLLAALGFIAYRAYENMEQKRQAEAAQQAARMANRPVSIAAITAKVGDIPVYLRGLGTATAFNTVNVKTRVDGPIVAVNYTEGQMVKEGEVLVEIDPRPFQAALDQAKGQLARDQAQLKDAQVNLARYQTLWNERVIAKQQLDTQAATVGNFQGTIEADQAAIETAQLNVGFTKVLAPISGRIGLRLVDIGNIVHAADTNPLVVITQLQPISVIFTLPADQLPPVLKKLNAGAKLPVDAYDRSDRVRISGGTLLTVDNTIDPTTGTARLKAIFNNQDNALFPNEFVNCRLLIDTRHNVVIIPTAAVQHGPQGAYVYIVNANQTASMRTVTTGVSEGNNVEITKGVAAGETVVTDGQDKLQEGSKVEIRSETAAPAPPSATGANPGNVNGSAVSNPNGTVVAPGAARGPNPTVAPANGMSGAGNPNGNPYGPGGKGRPGGGKRPK